MSGFWRARGQRRRRGGGACRDPRGSCRDPPLKSRRVGRETPLGSPLAARARGVAPLSAAAAMATTTTTAEVGAAAGERVFACARTTVAAGLGSLCTAARRAACGRSARRSPIGLRGAVAQLAMRRSACAVPRRFVLYLNSTPAIRRFVLLLSFLAHGPKRVCVALCALCNVCAELFCRYESSADMRPAKPKLLACCV